MSITLAPETQKLLDQLMQGGKFSSAEVAIHEALIQMTSKEERRAKALADFRASVEEAVEAADRGELYTFDEVWRQIDELKRQRVRTSA